MDICAGRILMQSFTNDYDDDEDVGDDDDDDDDADDDDGMVVKMIMVMSPCHKFQVPGYAPLFVQ